MSRKVVAFAASSSIESINKKLVAYAAGLLTDCEVQILDLNDFEMPIYSIDKERENGIPQLAHDFKAHLLEADAIVISFAEHNGAYSAAFKNIFDWISRIDKDVWGNKPMFILATSPGGRGAKTVLEIAVNKLKFMNKNTIAHFSLPGFKQNFSEADGILDDDLKKKFEEQLNIFSEAL